MPDFSLMWIKRWATLLIIPVTVSAACSTSHATVTPRLTPPTSALPTAAPRPVDQAVRSAWSIAFDVRQPAVKRAGWIQNGPGLLTWLRRQPGSSAWRGTTADVSSVALTDPGHAIVSYRLVRAGVTLVSAGGAAIESHGRWLVARSTVCALSVLRHDRAPGC